VPQAPSPLPLALLLAAACSQALVPIDQPPDSGDPQLADSQTTDSLHPDGDSGPLRWSLAVGAEEAAGETTGMSRPSIALDSLGQPHIVADLENPQVWIFHRIAGSWSEALFAERSDDWDASRVYLPHIEIDAQDQAWISAWLGVKDGGTMPGQGVWLLSQVSSAPASSWLGVANAGYKNGNLALDPFLPDQTVVMTKEGRWQRFDTGGYTGESGQLDVGSSGEKIRFAISPRQGESGVWHALMSGWSECSSSYRSSSLEARVEWASNTSYDEMGEDMLHPGMGLDGADPQVAYMAIAYDVGVVYNVWNGSALVFDPADLPVLDAEPAQHGNGGERFGPQWAPALFGGAFMCWTGGDGVIRVVHVDSEGAVSEAVEIGGGQSCAMTTDSDGDLHMAYVSGGMRYREIELVLE